MSPAQPLVSVIIPCYNVSAYIEKAVRSITGQSYKSLEILIIDDASTDDTLQKVRSIKDERVKIVALTENTKKVGAVNQALKQISGELICFQDGDDWSEKDRIKEQVKQFEEIPDLGICFTSYRFTGNTKRMPGKIALSNDELKDEFLNFGNKKNSTYGPTACGTMMISKKVLDKTGGYHSYFAGRVGEDIHWIYRILKNFKGITVNKILYNYHVRKESLTDIEYSGKNEKYAYSLQMLAKIIHADINEGVDILNEKFHDRLLQMELTACEEKLTETIKLLNSTKIIYESSYSLKLGRFLLFPLKIFTRQK